MKKYVYYLCIILAATSWGLIGIFNRTLNEMGLDVFSTIILRNVGAMVVMTVSCALFKREVFHIEKKHLPIFCGSGMFSVLFTGLCYMSCQMVCSLAIAGILMYLAPSFVVIMSRILWKEPITGKKTLALVLTLAGCVFICGLVGKEQTVSFVGVLLGIGAGFSYSTYTIFSRYGLQHYDASTMTYWTFVLCSIGSILLLPLTNISTVLTLTESLKGWMGVIGLVIISTVLPYALYTKGLEGIEGGKAAVIANVEPVVAALVGILFYHEILDIWTIFGIALILCGILILSKEEKESGKTQDA